MTSVSSDSCLIHYRFRSILLILDSKQKGPQTILCGPLGCSNFVSREPAAESNASSLKKLVTCNIQFDSGLFINTQLQFTSILADQKLKLLVALVRASVNPQITSVESV